jgi:hypothetical protein
MASRNPQTIAKRAREQAVKERRERKRAQKAEAAAAQRAAKNAPPPDEIARGDGSHTPASRERPPDPTA